MFKMEDLKKIDYEYFYVVVADDRDVTLQSKNTGHYWYLHCTEYPMESSCVIFHKHKFEHPYHKHGGAMSLGQAIRGIKKHDKWQMRGRK